LAITKQRKQEVLAEYQGWIDRSQAVVLVEYTGVSMKELDAIRARVRESGGEFHIVKNTLARRAFEAAGYVIPDGLLEKSTAVGFAFSDVGATAKALDELARGMPALKFKGGFLGREALDAGRVKALASLPTLPVARAMLLGVLQAPAGKLVRTLAEPARQLAYVLKAHADQSAPAAA
jgi:large subunit ribosomal protein L10